MTTFKKGYIDDVGVDIILDIDVEIPPFETHVIDIGVSIPTLENHAIMLCARSSAAMQGLIVNQCPIDPNYTGNVHIICHNCSNAPLLFKKGTAFAQLYQFKFEDFDLPIKIKRSGKRNDNNFGSTDKE